MLNRRQEVLLSRSNSWESTASCTRKHGFRPDLLQPHRFRGPTIVKQACDSSATGELGGLVKQLKRIECARNFLSEIRHPQPAPTPVYLDSQALVQAITKDGPHGLMKHEAKWIVRAREAVTRGIIQPILIPRHENIADPLTATRGPTDFIPMRDIMISMHQGALSEDEINHRLLYPHVRAARANVTARRTSAAQSAQQQDVRDHAQAAAGLG